MVSSARCIGPLCYPARRRGARSRRLPSSLVASSSLLSPGVGAPLWLAGGLLIFSGVPAGFVAAAVGTGRGLGDGDPGGAQDPLPDLVAGLQDLHAGVLGDVR